ncbi:MAG: hypothetical protein FWC50_02700 [Planctomycetaceae bacterium]|nr:hypothetical protein [Planctomycetaceae bacterium]
MTNPVGAVARKVTGHGKSQDSYPVSGKSLMSLPVRVHGRGFNMKFKKVWNITVGISIVTLFAMFASLIYFGNGHKAFTANNVWDMEVFFFAFFLPICGYPLFVSMLLSIFTKSMFAQVTLSSASFLYGIHFIYFGCFYVGSRFHTLFFFFAGYSFLHVLLPLWITAVVVEIWHRKQNKIKSERP